jgi:hypothetical protein
MKYGNKSASDVSKRKMLTMQCLGRGKNYNYVMQANLIFLLCACVNHNITLNGFAKFEAGL